MAKVIWGVFCEVGGVEVADVIRRHHEHFMVWGRYVSTNLRSLGSTDDAHNSCDSTIVC